MAGRLIVKYLPLTELEPYQRNARTHSEAQLAKLGRSLVEYGWTVPIAVAGKRILAGHGRLAAALKLRSAGTEIPGLHDQALAPTIDLSRLTPKQQRAYIIADNRIALDAGWDTDVLKIELAEIETDGFDLSLTGFDIPEIAGFLGAQDMSAAEYAREWGGMPEFQQGSTMPWRTMMVHFKTPADIAAFAKLVGQSVTEKTKSIWYPFNEQKTEHVTDKRYITEPEGESK